jgi:hypothetical protein
MKPQQSHRLGRTAMAMLLATLLSACNTWPTPPGCPSGSALRAEMLHGVWQVQLDGPSVASSGQAPAPWRLRLGPHPEHTGSLQGELGQGLQRFPVVADLDDGEFTLEESRDGLRIAATWLGTPTEGHCGRLIQGHRFEADQPGQPFRLQAQP